MSEPTDTSAEACAWMADALIGPDWSSERQDRAAALIRALAAERDEERRRAEYAEAALEDARANLAMLEPAAQPAPAHSDDINDPVLRALANDELPGGQEEENDWIAQGRWPPTAENMAKLWRRVRDADAAVAAAVERAAEMVDCGCGAASKVAAASNPHNSAARWNACGAANCGAIDAVAIRATIPSSAAAALAEYRRKVLEEAARVARREFDEMCNNGLSQHAHGALIVEKAIRALATEGSSDAG